MKDLGTALITGGAQRIGREISLFLSDLGYKIAVQYNRSPREAQSLRQEIDARNGACEIFHCDFSTEKSAGGLIQNVSKKFSDLTVLVNNASIFQQDSLSSLDTGSIQEHFMVNLVAPLLLSKNFARACKRGNIINILDTNITKNSTDHFSYLLSKKSLAEATMIAARNLAPGVRVNAIAPGYILPPVTKSGHNAAKRIRSIPLQVKGEIRQILQTVEFLLNNEYVTGQVIFVDGGEHLL